MTEASPTPISRYVAARDGLRLHLRDWPRESARVPVVCLPGLARTAADFDALAERLSRDRRVVALDYRGRGLSARDPDPGHYDLATENADILTVLDAQSIDRAIVVGTSRGGIHAMILGATRPGLQRAIVLNDIGPVLEIAGLARIKSYVGKLPEPTSWAEAAALARRTMGAQFTALTDADFDAYARLTFEETDGRFVPRYDPMLAKSLDAYDLEAGVPTLCPQFEALAPIPMLALRGENSDLLSSATLAEMARRHPALETATVRGQGHAPLLLDAQTIDLVARFVARVDP